MVKIIGEMSLYFPRQDKGSIEKAICKAHVEYGYRLREIGDHVGVHYSTISRVVKRMG